MGRFIKGYEGAGLTWLVGQNIVAVYQQVCAHIEHGNEEMRAEHEAHQSNLGMHQATDSAALLPPNDY